MLARVQTVSVFVYIFYIFKTYFSLYKVDEDRKITSSSILELGIPRVPIYEAVTQLKSAESTLEYGFPESDVLLLYERHVVWFDVQKRLAKWVAYKLTKDDIEGKSITVSDLTQFIRKTCPCNVYPL